jgi:glycine/sarcosine/betaine reductase complex component A
MDLENQARVKELAEQFGRDNLVVVIGSLETGGSEIAALTVTSGDPTYVGPLAGVSLGLPVYHILEAEIRAIVDPQVYEEEVELMEMALEESVEEIVRVTQQIRAEA